MLASRLLEYLNCYVETRKAKERDRNDNKSGVWCEQKRIHCNGGRELPQTLLIGFTLELWQLLVLYTEEKD